ncbi:MAG: methyltransferase domain-containing protein [Desulfatiglandales bacterium]
MLKLDIGCGQKKEGFIGIDIIPAEGVDFVLDITSEKIPLQDDTGDEVFSNHFFEHIDSPKEALEELIRVSVEGATFEIWTPYLKSNEAFVLGHRHFYNETIWRHICIEYPHFWLKDVEATLRLEKFYYVLKFDAVEELKRLQIPLAFALEHMFNIAIEMGAFMTVIKGKNVKGVKALEPEQLVSYSRQGPFERLEPAVYPLAHTSFSIRALLKRLFLPVG